MQISHLQVVINRPRLTKNSKETKLTYEALSEGFQREAYTRKALENQANKALLVKILQ